MKARDIEIMRDYMLLMKSHANQAIKKARQQTNEDVNFIGAQIKELRRRIRELDRLIAVTGEEIDVMRAAEKGVSYDSNEENVAKPTETI